MKLFIDKFDITISMTKVLLNYGVKNQKQIGRRESYLIGLEYSKHRLLVINWAINFSFIYEE